MGHNPVYPTNVANFYKLQHKVYKFIDKVYKSLGLLKRFIESIKFIKKRHFFGKDEVYKVIKFIKNTIVKVYKFLNC